MRWQCDFVYFCFALKVFRKDDLVDAGPVLWLLLQALLYNHVKVLRHALGDRLVFLRADFLF